MELLSFGWTGLRLMRKRGRRCFRFSESLGEIVVARLLCFVVRKLGLNVGDACNYLRGGGWIDPDLAQPDLSCSDTPGKRIICQADALPCLVEIPRCQQGKA